MNELIVCIFAVILFLYSPFGVIFWAWVASEVSYSKYDYLEIPCYIFSLLSFPTSFGLLYWLFEIKKGILFGGIK